MKTQRRKNTMVKKKVKLIESKPKKYKQLWRSFKLVGNGTGLLIFGWMVINLLTGNIFLTPNIWSLLTVLLGIGLVIYLVFLLLPGNRPVEFGSQSGTSSSNQKARVAYQRLGKLDELYKQKEKLEVSENLTLAEICERFRLFASRINDNPLYYSITDIRRYITSLAVSKVMVLQGMSGTGKTSLPVAFGKFTQVPATIVPVQPMWKERSDLIGYYNEFTGKFNESMILEKMYEANQSNKMFIMVLDELNIARVEYYFSEFLSLLELPTVEERIMEVSSTISPLDPRDIKNGKLVLPNNLWFIGTANNDDSTFAISDKVYDRAMIMNLDYRTEPFSDPGIGDKIVLTAEHFDSLIRQAKKDFSLTRRQKEHVKMLDQYLKTQFGVTFGNRIRRQIETYVPVYIACGGTELQALDDLLSKKVLRKLESQNPVYVKNKANELISKFHDIFGLDAMKECIATVQRFITQGG
jgi:MoxR-like ATPase